MKTIANKVSDAELEILKVLWVQGNPMTDKQLRDALSEGSDWSRTTIQTLVKRLIDKGVLLREKREIFYYRPAFSEEEFAKASTEELLYKIFNGNVKTLVSTMLNNEIMSESDMEYLKEYWAKRREEK